MDLDQLFTMILDAERRIKPFIVHTPVIVNDDIDSISGKKIFFKCENLQKTGVCKARGALNAVLAHLETNPNLSGVVTHSCGNHGQSLAWAARLCGISCTVVVPFGTTPDKIALIKKYGAACVVCDATPTARKEACARIAKEENRQEVNPYDDLLVIAGQGTRSKIALIRVWLKERHVRPNVKSAGGSELIDYKTIQIGLEFLRQVPDLDMILLSISGGGIAAGISVAIARISPRVQVCPVEPVGKDLQRSLEASARLWPNPPVFLPTIAESIRTQQIGEIAFPIMCQYTAKKVFTVTDDEMIRAMKWSWQNLKMIVELSSAPGVAVVLSNGFRKETAKNIGVILCGGNCSVEKLLWN